MFDVRWVLNCDVFLTDITCQKGIRVLFWLVVVDLGIKSLHCGFKHCGLVLESLKNHQQSC